MISVANKDDHTRGGATHELVSCSDDADRFFSALSSGGALFELRASPQDYPSSVSLHRRDPVNGRPTLVVGLAETSPAQFVSYSYRFAVDNGTLYIVRRRVDGNTEVWKMTFSPKADAAATRILDQNLGFEPYWLTVYDGHMMLAGTSGMVFRWDIGTDRKHTLQYTVQSGERQPNRWKEGNPAAQPFRFYTNLIDVCVQAIRA